jgi:hypothetical protein
MEGAGAGVLGVRCGGGRCEGDEVGGCRCACRQRTWGAGEAREAAQGGLRHRWQPPTWCRGSRAAMADLRCGQWSPLVAFAAEQERNEREGRAARDKVTLRMRILTLLEGTWVLQATRAHPNTQRTTVFLSGLAHSWR